MRAQLDMRHRPPLPLCLRTITRRRRPEKPLSSGGTMGGLGATGSHQINYTGVPPEERENKGRQPEGGGGKNRLWSPQLETRRARPTHPPKRRDQVDPFSPRHRRR